MGMMDTIETQTYYCDVSKWRVVSSSCGVLLWRFKIAQIWNNTPTTPTTSFLDFSRLEHAQAAHEHTEQPTTQLESVSFVDAISTIEWLMQQSFNWPFGDYPHSYNDSKILLLDYFYKWCKKYFIESRTEYRLPKRNEGVRDSFEATCLRIRSRGREKGSEKGSLWDFFFVTSGSLTEMKYMDEIRTSPPTPSEPFFRQVLFFKS